MTLQKIPFEQFKKDYTPFFVDQRFENEVEREINEIVENLYDKMKDVDTKEGLLEYIKDDEESLNNILSLINFSAEKFRRIATMFRMEENTSFKTEWDLKRIRKEIISDQNYAEKILMLLLEGASNEELADKIPKYYLENLVIDEKAMAQLQDKYQLRRLVKNKRDGRYNNSVGDKIEDRIEEELKKITESLGVTYEREKFVNWIARNMDFVIPNRQDPHVIIEVSYQITTGSSQTTKRVDEVKTSSDIRNHNIQTGKNIAFVNFIEGLGWIARQSDMKRIYDCSDYVINLNNLSQIEEIIKQHVPKRYFK